MKVRECLATSLVVLFFAVASFGEPGGRGPVNNSGSPRMWSDLKLTAEQQEKLKELRDEMSAARSESANELQVIRKKIVEELRKSKPSKSTLDKYAREVGECNEKITIEQNNHLLKIKEMFTQEQFNMMIEDQRGDGTGSRNGSGREKGQGRGKGKGSW